jgi:membrane dipeptidase
MIPYFDLHCDTLREAYLSNCNLYASPLHISLDEVKYLKEYIQITAIWSDCRLSDHDAFSTYGKILSYAKNQGLSFAKDFDSLKKDHFILSIEDARIIENDLSRVDNFYNDGVKFITLNWSGTNIIGGAWDTDNSLSDFGKKVVLKCFNTGIIPDVSHSSRSTMHEVMELAKNSGKKIVATHSNSHFAHPHGRNLTDEEFSFFVDAESIVGISLCPSHIAKGEPGISDIMNHIYHYLSLGGINTICMGCDFDGISSLPRGITGISDIYKIYDEINALFGEKTAKKIFFENAYDFMRKNLI